MQHTVPVRILLEVFDWAESGCDRPSAIQLEVHEGRIGFREQYVVSDLMAVQHPELEVVIVVGVLQRTLARLRAMSFMCAAIFL